MAGNSLKMYDKQGSVLRIETTINDPHMFRSLRKAQGTPNSAWVWRPMRKSVADAARRAQVSRDANHRYLEALAVVGDATATHRVLDPITRPVQKDGRSCRALRPVNAEDAALFAAVLRGDYLLRGFSNSDLQAALFDRPAPGVLQARRRSAWVGYRLRLLRRHGLIHKIGRQRLYRVTPKGHQTMTLSLLLRSSNATLLQAA